MEVWSIEADQKHASDHNSSVALESCDDLVRLGRSILQGKNSGF